MQKLSDHTILLKIYQEQQKMQTQIQKIQIQVEEIPAIKKQVEEIPKIKKQLEEIPKIKKQLEEIPKIKEELRKISGSVAKIEVEHGEKLQILFDAFKMHAEKLEQQEKKINNCELQSEKNSDQIYYLKSKVQGL